MWSDDDFAALKQDRNARAETLAQIEAHQPGITDAAKAWLARIDRASGGAADDSDWPETN